MAPHRKILVVDDEPVMRESLSAWLKEDGYEVHTAASGEEAVELAGRTDYRLLFADLKMPGIDGIETMRRIRELRPDISSVIITAYATLDTAITAMKEGAEDYVVKPCAPHEISMMTARIFKMKSLEHENVVLRKKLSRTYGCRDIVSKNSKMQDIFSLIRDIADLPSTVFIQGESGTGKELVARAIHDSGVRREKPFVAISCAALTDTLLGSELFGHEKGSFTGAIDKKIGKFELANEGTLFLDEIGDISPKMQVDLLRVLQQRTFYRVGGNKEIRVDVRVIAATNANIQALVKNGAFREDLFYRLNVINVRIPPLRDRREDVPLLSRHFIERINVELKKNITDISQEATNLLMGYSWPGNVRELENAVERAIVTCRQSILSAEDFGFLLERDGDSGEMVFSGDLSLAKIEKNAIETTLVKHHGNIKETAAVLGIDRSTLYEKLKKYNISR